MHHTHCSPALTSPPRCNLYIFHFVKEHCLKSTRLSTTRKKNTPLFAHCSTLSLPASKNPVVSGGAGRDRTDDPRLAKPMLSQLSYSPTVSSTYSVPVWWVWLGSNQRPSPYQDGALTS